MSRTTAEATIAAYYAAFNAGNITGMIETLHDDFVHHVNEGATRMGKAAFAEFCAHMSQTYKEDLRDMVVMATAEGTRGAAEFVVHGQYLKTDPGLPEAHGATCSAVRLDWSAIQWVHCPSHRRAKVAPMEGR